MGFVRGDLVMRQILSGLREVLRKTKELPAVAATLEVLVDLLPFAFRPLALNVRADQTLMRVHSRYTCLNVVILNLVFNVLRMDSKSCVIVSRTRFSCRFLTVTSGGWPNFKMAMAATVQSRK